MPRPSLPLLLLMLMVQFCAGPFLAAQIPTVDRIETVNFGPGSHASLSVYGKGLKDVLYLWTPLGRLPFKATDPVTETVALFEGTISPAAIPGVYESRIVTAAGISARRFVLLDDLPTFAMQGVSEENPPNTVLPIHCCVDGYLNAVKPKYFGLNLDKGQQVSIEVYARRLDSPLDPVLRLTDSTGKEMAFADDTPGLSGDAQLRFIAPATGKYVLQLRDVKYSGGSDYYFHLRIGRFSLIQGTYPRRTSLGANVRIVGAEGERSVAVAEFTTGVDDIGLVVPLAVASGNAGGSSLTSVATARISPVLEVEPNDSRETATSTNAKTEGISGRFESAGDIDWFRVSAEAGQHLCVTAHARDVGSPADVQLRLYDIAGKLLQQSDDSGENDAQVFAPISVAGDVFVEVHELSRQFGSMWTYDLELQRSGRLEVTTSVDSVAIPDRGAIGIPLTIKRIGHHSAFELSVANLPAGIESSPVMIASNQNTAFLCLRSTGDVVDHYSSRLSIDCRVLAESSLGPVLSVAKPADGKANYQLYSLQAGVFAYPATPAAFSLVSEPTQLEIVRNTEAVITIKAVRTGDWNQPIDLASAIPAGELPPGITVTTAQIAIDSAEVTIKASPNVIPGRYSLSLNGTLKKDKLTIVQPVPTIMLTVSEPRETES